MGALLVTFTSATLNRIGAPNRSLDQFVLDMALGFSQGGSLSNGIPTTPSESAWSAVLQGLDQFGDSPALTLILFAGMTGLVYRPLFRRELPSFAASLAVATYGIAHAIILFQCADLVLGFAAHPGIPKAVWSGFV